MNIKEKVEDFVYDAKAITWDTCHKIYVLMDDEQVQQMRDYEYEPIITKADATAEQMIEMLQKWFDESCGLRFISAVETNHEDPNAGFTNLVSQFEDEDEITRCAVCNFHEVDDEGDTCRSCEPEDEDEDED